jgi:hypothetical protein
LTALSLPLGARSLYKAAAAAAAASEVQNSVNMKFSDFAKSKVKFSSHVKRCRDSFFYTCTMR